MNVPLGLALTELIAETDMPVIAHHHDFTWERSRYVVTAAHDYLRSAFPPDLPRMWHMVINSFASRQLALRTGISSMLIPNVMDFESSPPELDGYADDLRAELGISPGEYFLLQPTRIVPRKRIELAIELTRRLGDDCTLVISHHSGDEGANYEEYLRGFARMLDVRVIFAAERFSDRRGRTAEGMKVYSLADAYQQADLVTYPSRVEGFGNAFLEAIYYKTPIVMSTYEIFKTDILPKGFKIIGIKDFIEPDSVEEARKVLQDPTSAADIVDHNYEVACQYYSYRTLENRLITLLNECLGFS
jgi:mannosylglucosylglycerate synthase